MFAQYYIKTQNRVNHPNKYPSNGVKCSVCQLIFPTHQIEQHMASHISPQYMTPNPKNNTLKKMPRPRLFLQENQNNFMQTGLKTVKREQMPKQQNIRILKSTAQHITRLPNNQNLNKLFNRIQLAKFDQTEVQTAFGINNVQRQFLQRETLQQNLILEKQNVQLQKMFLQTQTSEKTSSKPRNSFQLTQDSWARSTRMQGKKWKNTKEDDNQTQAYEITAEKRPMFQEFLHVFKTQDQKKCEVKLQKYKPPQVRSQSICTKSNNNKQIKKSSSFQLLTSFFGCKEVPKDLKFGQITVNMNNTATTGQFWKTGSSGFNRVRQHKCQDCGGFYCATCNSTIPPQYRPANMYIRDERTKQFYDKFVYSKGCNNYGMQQNSSRDCKDCNQ